MKQIGFIVGEKWMELLESEQLTADKLKALDIEAVPLDWADPTVDWNAYSLLIIRSTWDYFKRFEEFMRWFERMEAQKITTWNSLSLVRWNLDKNYLRDMEQKGIKIAPTVWLKKGTSATLAEIFQQQGWDTAVIKPTVAGGAFKTWRVSAENAAEHQQNLEEILAHSDAMVQQYVPQIETDGEWSLIFLGGEYSHTIIKHPEKGDFRVQTDFGGKWEYVNPPAHLLDQAKEIMKAVSEPTLYGRVDGVAVNGELILMELEIFEPYLFLDDQSAERFARIIAKML